jgi:hypothetical protein
MSLVIATAESMVSAARDLAKIGSMVSSDNALAATRTSSLVPAATDEVSTQIAAFFNACANDFRALSAHAATFHESFVQSLLSGAASYAEAEAANAAPLQRVLAVLDSPAQALGQPLIATTIGSTGTALIMGGTFEPEPPPSYVTAINNLFIQPNPTYTGYSPFGLYTPEEVHIPFIKATGPLTVGQSILQGEFILNNAIMATPPGSHTLVFSYSQSSVISSIEIKALDALPANLRPSPSDLSFMLIGDGDAPNGGIFTRFPGTYISVIDLPFFGATPPDTPYPTTIYTLQYDGFADFPQYPLDIFADANALLGTVYVHPNYASLTPQQIQSAVPQATSPGYYENGGATHYYMIPTQNLPLLDPLRSVPIIGTPLADLLQPDLTVLVNLGYDPNGYANVVTPAQLIPGFSPSGGETSPPPNFNAASIYGQLVTGAQQGVTDALVDIGVLPASDFAKTYPAINNISYVAPVAE